MKRVDLDQVKEWLEILHGKSSGVLHVCSTDDWTGVRGAIDTAIRYVSERDAQGVSGIYLRVTTLTPGAPTDRGKRAGAAHSASLPGLWADIDINGPGHKHETNHPDFPGYNDRRPIRFPLPGDEESARRIVTESGLPTPTLWVHSGGGLYPWWLLEDPEELTGDEFAIDAAEKLSDGWQKILVWSANKIGFDYGNVGDLARVLRVPGTWNRKAGGERPCRLLENSGPLYSFENLAGALFALQDAALPPPPPPRTTPVAIAPSPTRGPMPGSPLDAFELAASWHDILEPHGWQVHHTEGATTHWTRPGKRRSMGSSATTGHSSDGRDRMWVFSTACGLPTSEPMTKPYVWGMLNHGFGDMKKVAKELVRMGFGTPVAPTGFTTPLSPLPSSNGAAPAVPVVQAPVTAPPTRPLGGLQVQPPPLPSQPFQPLPGTTPPITPGWCPTPIHPMEAATLPPFPTWALPPVVADLVQQVAASKQVDPTMPALFALAAVSAVSAGRVEALRSGGWREPLSLYTCPVAESGERKSPTGRSVFGAIRRIEDRMRAEHNERVDAEVDELDKQRATLRGNPAAANRIEERIAAAESSRKRPPRIAMSNDITPEALVRALAHQGGHGAILDPEGTFLGTLSGRYSSGTPNPELFIKAYDGDPYTVDRISRDPDRIARPTLALGLAVQRVVLDEVMRSKQLMERGAVARIIFGFPKSLVGTRWESNSAPYDPTPERKWGALLEGISELPVPESPDEVPAIALSPEALQEHMALSDKTESRLGPGGDLTASGLKEWAHKHPGRVLRISALLHLASGRDTRHEVSLDTMRHAVAIGEWAIEHARHAHRIDGESPEEATRKQCSQVLDWVTRTKQGAFTVRDACRAVRAQWVTTKSMADALDQLAELGWVREEPYQDRAGRFRVRFVVSPFAGPVRSEDVSHPLGGSHDPARSRTRGT